MSSIDMVEFIKNNAASLEPEFQIWSGAAFIDFSVNTATGVVTSNPSVASPSFVAPLQSFILKYKGSGNVSFNVASISTVRPANAAANLRSAGTGEVNILRIKAENSLSASHALVANRELGSQNVQKLFSPFDDVPEVYTLAGEIPVGIHFISNSTETTVPLGLKTTQLGTTTFTFTGMDNYRRTSRIVLVDKLLNKEIDLTNQPDVSYSFENLTQGIQNDRFYVRFGASLVSVAGPESDGGNIRIYSAASDIVIQTPASDPIRFVQIYDLLGRKVYEEEVPSGVNDHRISGRFDARFVVVRVYTDKQVKSQPVVLER
jgi:hypothetical protein